MKIGFLIPDKEYISAFHGAEIAVLRANSNKGLNGRPFELVVRSMEGPWGEGSRQAVSLIFDDKVWALAGSHDGRNAHLVEQAATKSGIVFVSANSADPSLAYAFVPWFFNCVPDNLQQAEAILEDVKRNSIKEKALIIIDDGFDSQKAREAFIRKNNENGNQKPAEMISSAFLGTSFDLKTFAESENIGYIFIACSSQTSVEVVNKITARSAEIPIYGTLSIPDENLLKNDQMKVFNEKLKIPAGIWNKNLYDSFASEYRNKFGRNPRLIACYAFDGISALINAIIKAGSSNREDIQNALRNINIEGVTGKISFDGNGKRQGLFTPVSLYNGLPIQTSR
ncbi:MAG: ABC transporter substrate-binding protein [Bacteroidales bacterium]